MHRTLPHASRLAFPVLLVAAFAACSPGDPEPLPEAPTQVVAVDTPIPEYPVSLACADIGGRVELTLVVGADGRPVRATLARGSGVPELDQLALEAVQDWQFRPATYDGRPVESTIQVPVNFRPPPPGDPRCADYAG